MRSKGTGPLHAWVGWEWRVFRLEDSNPGRMHNACFCQPRCPLETCPRHALHQPWLQLELTLESGMYPLLHPSSVSLLHSQLWSSPTTVRGGDRTLDHSDHPPGDRSGAENRTRRLDTYNIQQTQKRIVISIGFGVRETSVKVPTHPLTNCMTFAKLFNLSKPQEPHLLSYLIILWWSNDMTHEKSLALWLEHSKSPSSRSGQEWWF